MHTPAPDVLRVYSIVIGTVIGSDIGGAIAFGNPLIGTALRWQVWLLVSAGQASRMPSFSPPACLRQRLYPRRAAKAPTMAVMHHTAIAE